MTNKKPQPIYFEEVSAAARDLGLQIEAYNALAHMLGVEDFLFGSNRCVRVSDVAKIGRERARLCVTDKALIPADFAGDELDRSSQDIIDEAIAHDPLSVDYIGGVPYLSKAAYIQMGGQALASEQELEDIARTDAIEIMKKRTDEF